MIDNTIIVMSRPGGPTTGGEQELRVDKLVQQAWRTGWKKLHGMKWQTLDLPHKMKLDVWGPESVRHNDNFTLEQYRGSMSVRHNNNFTLGQSNIEGNLRHLQQRNVLKFKFLGDSAYSDTDITVTGGGRRMSATRETIEWNYKDLKIQWIYLDYKFFLKLQNQPIAKITFVRMLLCNAH